MAQDLGFYTITTAAISSNTTTTISTPANANHQKIYVKWVGIDVSVAGTTSTAKVNGSGGAVTVGLYATTAVGHQESYSGFDGRIYPGIELTQGESLQVVTTGGAAATLTVTVVFEVRG